MPARSKSSPRISEAALQAQIVEGLRVLGYEVLVTSARSVRQGYGADHGVPDLLVSVSSPGRYVGHWLGLEIKRPDGPVRWSHPRQRELWESNRTAIARSLEDALFAIWFCTNGPVSALVRKAAMSLPVERRGEVIHGA